MIGCAPEAGMERLLDGSGEAPSRRASTTGPHAQPFGPNAGGILRGGRER